MADKPMTPAEQMAYMQKLAAYYGQKGEDALTEDILKSVREEKEAGRLNDDMIMSMANNLARFLSPQQKQKLDALVKQLISPQLDDKSSRR